VNYANRKKGASTVITQKKKSVAPWRSPIDLSIITRKEKEESEFANSETSRPSRWTSALAQLFNKNERLEGRWKKEHVLPENR